MKKNKELIDLIYKKFFLLLMLGIILLSGCYGTVDWYESFRFKGTVEEKLLDEEMLVIKEYDAPEGRQGGYNFEIPVDDVENYEIGDRLLVIVETNTPTDDWDLDNLRFELKPIED